MRRQFAQLRRAVVARLRTTVGGSAFPALVDSSAEKRPATGAGRDETDDEADLLSSTEEVLEILESEGGRLWQHTIVDRSKWSKSTVSRALSDLEESGKIVRSRVGRRKVVFIAGEEPELVDTPGPGSPESPGPDDRAAATEPGEPALDD